MVKILYVKDKIGELYLINYDELKYTATGDQITLTLREVAEKPLTFVAASTVHNMDMLDTFMACNNKRSSISATMGIWENGPIIAYIGDYYTRSIYNKLKDLADGEEETTSDDNAE